MRFIPIKKLFLIFILMLPILSFAATSEWEIVAPQSSIKFTATQNNAPVSGEFKKFTGQIQGDLDQLEGSNVRITVDMNSVTTSYGELTDALKTADWLNIKLFPHAVFKANKFTKINDKTYQAEGVITIRDVNIPVTISFTIEQYTKNKARIKGTLNFKRSSFGIGQGEWADTSEIKDDVKVDFTLTAVRKSQ